ncbi:hypothetical protein OG900_32215 [Streptomyces sp. NBC_00433]
MGAFFKECEHPASRWSKCPHTYKIRCRDASGKQVEESGFTSQDAAIERLTDIFRAKKSQTHNRSKAERIRKYGPLQFADFAAEWLPDGMTLYGFRRFFASNCLSHGIPTADVAEWMGHRSLDITFRIYRRLMPGSINKTAKILDLGLAA